MPKKLSVASMGFSSLSTVQVEGDVTMTDIGVTQPRMGFRSRTLVLLIAFLAQMYTSDANAASYRQEHRCLALNLYFEARGEGRRGMIAVGWIVLNRVRSRDFPATPCQVVYQGGEQPPCQFSWWCDGRSDRPRSRDSWQLASTIAANLLTDPPPDPTRGALFYHSTSVKPRWHRDRVRIGRLGKHIFYR